MPALNAVEVARELRRSRSWFYKHRKELEARGFPRQLPVAGTWSGTAVATWLDAGGKVAAVVRQDQEEKARNRAFGL